MPEKRLLTLEQTIYAEQSKSNFWFVPKIAKLTAWLDSLISTVMKESLLRQGEAHLPYEGFKPSLI